VAVNYFSRTLIFFGAALILTGLALQLFGKIPGIGRLPGDIHIQKGNFSFYFPLATSLLASVILSLVFALLSKK
jgi:hypothetical protein